MRSKKNRIPKEESQSRDEYISELQHALCQDMPGVEFIGAWFPKTNERIMAPVKDEPSEGQKRYEQFKDYEDPEAIRKFNEQMDYLNGTGKRPDLPTWEEESKEIKRRFFEELGREIDEYTLETMKIYRDAEREENELIRIYLQRQKEGKDLSLSEMFEISQQIKDEITK